MSECANRTPSREAETPPKGLSIHTKKITDSCRDKDCIEDLRVYLTTTSQNTLDSATTAKVRCADLIDAYLDVEPVAFDGNHYCVSLTFYYRILADATIGTVRPAALSGLAVFSKQVVLCGEESSARIFTSSTVLGGADGAGTASRRLPTAVVEVLEPMVLSSCVRESSTCPAAPAIQIPPAILQAFDEDIVVSGDTRRLFVSLGQFSVVRLERDVQMCVPVLGYAIPTKQCCDEHCAGEDPCEMFARIPFPAERFTP